MTLGVLAAALATHASAQTPSPFQPSLQDPKNTPRFSGAPDAVTRDREAGLVPSSAGETGFDSTGAIRKKKPKPRPGSRHVGKQIEAAPRSVALLPPARSLSQQQAGGHVAPQIAARSIYADVYKPSDATQRRPPVPFADAFDPVGVRANGFLLRPSIEVTRGYDTNPSRVPGGIASGFTAITPELQARSEWSQHELGASLRGSYTRFDQLSSLDRPNADAKVFGRIDASRDTRVDLESRFGLGTDYPGSPNLPVGIAKLPIYTSYGGTAGVVQRFNRLEVGVKMLADRTTYRDSLLTDGSTFSNHDRDYNQFGGQVRTSYELVPGLKPFAEIGADKRVHDLQFDRNGEQRNSNALTPKVGTTFEFTKYLTGEVSIGYLTRKYQDPTLQDLRGVVADASLVWAATGLTTATLTATSRGDESVVQGVSGALRRDVGLQVDHAFRRWLIGTVKFGMGFDEYVGLGRQDTRTSLGTALTYKFNRDLSLKGEIRHDWMRSNFTGVGYSASTFLLGVKLQR